VLRNSCDIQLKVLLEKATWKAFVDGVSMYERYTHDGLCGSLILVNCSLDFALISRVSYTRKLLL